MESRVQGPLARADNLNHFMIGSTSQRRKILCDLATTEYAECNAALESEIIPHHADGGGQHEDSGLRYAFQAKIRKNWLTESD